MLVKFAEEEDNIYMCSCSDWVVVNSASNEKQASKKAVSYLIDNYL